MLQNNWTKKFLTPSRLDTFQMYINENKLFKLEVGKNWLQQKWTLNNDPTLQDYINQLLGLSGAFDVQGNPVPSIAACMGDAIHLAIEKHGIDSMIGNVVEVNNNKDWVNVKDETSSWNISASHELDVSELTFPQHKEVWVNGNINGLDVRAKLDGLDFDANWETKTIEHKDDWCLNRKYEQYESSNQWKMGLMITNRDICFYDMFVYEKDIKVDEGKIITSKDLFIKHHERWQFKRYSGMEYEISCLIVDFYNFLMDIQPQIKKTAEDHNIKIPLLTIPQENKQ